MADIPEPAEPGMTDAWERIERLECELAEARRERDRFARELVDVLDPEESTEARSTPHGDVLTDAQHEQWKAERGGDAYRETNWVADTLRKRQWHAAADHVLQLAATVEAQQAENERLQEHGCRYVVTDDGGTSHCSLAEAEVKNLHNRLATLIETVREEAEHLHNLKKRGNARRLREAADKAEGTG